MKEKLYTIPVFDAFKTDCECPLCVMKQELETSSIEFTLGPSYMEDDIRAITDELGFCSHHIQLLYQQPNRLGLALMLDTHLKKTRNLLEKKLHNSPSQVSFFKKKSEKDSPVSFLNKVHQSCFVCNRMEQTFNHYISTIYYLYKTEPDFRPLLLSSKGFCLEDFSILYDNAAEHLKGNLYQQFIEDITTVCTNNLERMQEELDWFIDKFDYRNANAPWKNSKDALPRAIQKINGVKIKE